MLEGKRGLKLTREKYAIVNNKNSLLKFDSQRGMYADEEGTRYTDEWCAKQLNDSLKNYDLNMEYFSLLDHVEFCEEIKKFLIKNSEFNEVHDLNLYDGKSGYYLMVLNEYCQVYVGTSFDIKKRIRQHWSNSKAFDRLLFPMGNIEASILSIDSFRSLDTTRIFVYKTGRTFSKEDKFINQISAKYLCNRLGGGKITGGLPKAITMIKTRNLK